MGGTNSETINGLRFHISSGDVHIHDDKRSLKFERDQEEFRDDLFEAFDELGEDDGIYKILPDRGASLNVLKEGRNFSVFLSDSKSVKSKLKAFAKGC